ncbi:sphingoid long chain base kinase 4 [Arthroderma uncinatum]|uniref:sphingoid long chain base kinase 4 n=1 Tax=Arthroderma uncinatum TaxID=74035 RepID=UPI00144AE6C7|nr:sphingoid long chain base kinase 4 [Arthroderma uncinatum]KAF3480157.1 sphingoid long chain base kinase 4 [Arthroderma uncinatum]
MTFSRFFSSSADDGRGEDAEMQAPRDGTAVLPVGVNASLTLAAESLIVQGVARTTRSIPYFNILWADISDNHLNIKYANPKSKNDVGVATICYTIERTQLSKAETWISSLLDLSYGEAQRNKRIKVLVNPFGGKGSASKTFYKEVEPIFEAARCEIDTQVTEYSGHAVDIAEKIDVDAWDVIAACSGDGVIFEIFNGLGKKENAGEALAKLAVAHVPCGSGNAMSRNLNGTAGPSMAALCIIKGLRTPLDLVSITHGEQRTLSFLSQAFGIIADTDLGTENLRWMGAARFTFGFLVRLLGSNVYPCDVALKVEIDDKNRIKEHYNAIVQNKSNVEPRGEIPESGGLPPLKYGLATDPIPEDWMRISHDKLGNFYSGNMAFMAQDANFFPASLPNDGFLDVIMIRGDISRITALQMLGALDNGELFDMPDVHALKISGFRITPRSQDDGYISIDGEKIPYEPFQAEVHKGLGTVISRSGFKFETGKGS